MFPEYIGTIIIKEASCQRSKRYWPVLEKSGFEVKVDNDGQQWMTQMDDDGWWNAFHCKKKQWPWIDR